MTHKKRVKASFSSPFCHTFDFCNLQLVTIEYGGFAVQHLNPILSCDLLI